MRLPGSVISGLFTVVAVTAYAAPPAVPTDAGRVLKDNPLPPSAPVPPPPAQLKAPDTPRPAAPEAADDVRVDVTAFNFSGNTVISTDVLQAAVAAWSGKSLNFGELVQVTEKVEAVYRDAGYLLAQAVLPPQQIHSGVVTIAITEGRLGKVRIEGESRVSPDVWYRYLDRLPLGEVATEALLDRQALLISEVAGARANLDLQAGEAPGTTDVVLVHQPVPFFTGDVSVDNYGMPSTGEYRLGLNAALNSPLHLGDRLSGNVMFSNTGNLRTYALRYELPVGGNGWRTYIAKTRALYSLGGRFAALEAHGTADSWRLGVSYPWLRSRKVNLNLQLEADYSRLRDVIASQSLVLGKYSYGLTFTPALDWQDNWLGGGSNQASLELRYGQLSLGRDAKQLDQPPDGADTDGGFGKLTINLFRQQSITNRIVLNVQWKQQFASDNLDSSEKLSIGGAQTLVAYPSSQATADEGGIGKLDLRWQALNNLSLGVFAEYARIELLHNPLVRDNNAIYRDAGFALSWSLREHLDLNASMAWAINKNPNPSDNDRPRVWANLTYGW